MPRLQSRIDFDGAIINVRVELGAVEEAYLRAWGQPIPQPFSTTALIDTGASHTAVDPMILNHLGVIQRGVVLVRVPGHANAHMPLYDVRVSLEIHHPAFDVQVAKIVPATHTVAVLIGRDILKNGTLLFDGQNNASSFWF
jgi:predicted aspartyl protease